MKVVTARYYIGPYHGILATTTPAVKPFFGLFSFVFDIHKVYSLLHSDLWVGVAAEPIIYQQFHGAPQTHSQMAWQGNTLYTFQSAINTISPIGTLLP